MKRIFIATAAVLASLFVAFATGPRSALACTGPGAIDGMLRTELIFEGRVVAVEDISDVPDSSGRLPKQIRFEVERGHRGTSAGDSIETVGLFPIPGKPIMCPQFPEAMVGKYVIIGADTDVTPLPLVDAWNMVFIGDEPAGDDYDRAVTFVEMMADSNPSAPLLSFDRAIATCGEPLTFHAVRLPAGRYVLTYAFSGRIVAAPTVGASGEFTATARVVGESCRRDDDYHALLAFHLRLVEDVEHGEMRVVEVASIPRVGAVDREPWGPLLTFEPPIARCGQPLTVSGLGFEPGEELRLGVGVVAGERTLQVDAEGAFRATFSLPGGKCGGTFLQAWVVQAEFGLPGPLFALTGRDTLLEAEPVGGVAPGPPDAGNGVTADGCLYAGDRARLSSSAVIAEVEVVGSMTPPSDPRTVLFPRVRPKAVLQGTLPDEPLLLKVAVDPPLAESCAIRLDLPRYLVLALERPTPGQDWSYETATSLILFAGPELAGGDYLKARQEIVAAVPGVPAAGSGLSVAKTDNDLPCADIVVVAILVMAFAGGTVAITRTVRRR